jgi:uncharacterized membrane protein
MAPPTLRPLSVGEILDVSFTLYRRHFAPLAGVAIVCSGIPVILNMFIEAAGGMLENLPLVLVYYIVFAALSSVATAATVFIVSESYLGRPIDARTALRRAAPYIGRILVCSMLTAFAVGIGLFLFLIPGLVLIAGLILAVPAIVIEPRLSASAALSRSWELTRGSRWRMFGLLLVLVVLLYIPIAAIGGLVALFVPGAGTVFARPGVAVSVAAVAISGVAQIFIYPLFYCVLTVAYYDLRVRKEGFDLEVLAATLLTA